MDAIHLKGKKSLFIAEWGWSSEVVHNFLHFNTSGRWKEVNCRSGADHNQEHNLTLITYCYGNYKEIYFL